MIKKLLPVILLVVGVGVGAGAGMFLRPAPEPKQEPAEIAETAEPTEAKDDEAPQVVQAPKKTPEEGDAPEFEYVKMSNQFVIPVVEGPKVQALVVIALSLEVKIGQKDSIYLREPKLRDSFLQVLFDHANVGGFEGEFTDVSRLKLLRRALLEIAQRDVGTQINDVLITEIARQDY